ncbi:MAG TPA: hypothetical protein VN132_09205, partial [Bdellovibrio sp.]|nr:hypothetical protein [Bdellovibrio sp.]
MLKVKVLLTILVIFSAFSFTSCKSKESKPEGLAPAQAPVGIFGNEPNTLLSDVHQLTFVGPKSGE